MFEFSMINGRYFWKYFPLFPPTSPPKTINESRVARPLLSPVCCRSHFLFAPLASPLHTLSSISESSSFLHRQTAQMDACALDMNEIRTHTGGGCSSQRQSRRRTRTYALNPIDVISRSTVHKSPGRESQKRHKHKRVSFWSEEDRVTTKKSRSKA